MRYFVLFDKKSKCSKPIIPFLIYTTCALLTIICLFHIPNMQFNPKCVNTHSHRRNILKRRVGLDTAPLGGERSGEIIGAKEVNKTNHSTTPLANLTKPWELNNRLERTVQPQQYDLFLSPQLDKECFSGEVKIKICVTNATDYIYLHRDKLNITETQVLDDKNTTVEINKTFNYGRNEYFVITFKTVIQPGNYILNFKFNGTFNKRQEGFYESLYTNIQKLKRRIATSKFEPTYARQAFPCFDEPNMKAKFYVKLVKPNDKYIALSNMIPKNTTVDSPTKGVSTVEFDVTVPMSTYLVCFIVCDFDHLPSQNSSQGFPITVYAREGQLDYMLFAQNIAVKAINFYIDYFKVPYPLPKLDLIAIPDFVSGAMEHWGLVTFREAAVIFKNGSSSVGNMKRVAMTTSHELAHMWFGDLVTMDWWNDLWLNEGFASYMQYKALAVVEPSWEVDTLFLVDNLHNTLQLDQTLTSHPIVQTVSNPDQITEIFDVISYQKGSSVIRMLENMMGADNFSKGVTSYLQEFQFKNAETQDLWNHLQKFTDGTLNVTSVMDTFTRQMGYPLITVKRQGDKVTFSQTRYLSNMKATYNVNDSPYKYSWDVYISLISSKNPEEPKTVWLYRDMLEANLTIAPDTTWIKINKNQVGFFRVNYEDSMWHALIDQLIKDHKVFDPRDRANLLDDVFNLADSQLIEYTTAFKLTQYLAKEEHYVPWSVVNSKLSRLDDKLQSTPGHEDFKKYIRCLLKYKQVDETWKLNKEDTFLETSSKLIINELMCSFGVPGCLQKAEELLRKWFETGTKPDADLRGLVYRYGMENIGTEEEWNKMWAKFKEETNPQEQIKMMAGLASVKDTKLLERFLEMAKDEKNIRSQDYFSVVIMVSTNPNGLQLAWTYVKKNWEYLVKRFSLNHRIFGRVMPSVAGKFNTEDQLAEVKDFFAKYPEAGAGASGRKQTLEMISNNIKWMSAQGQKLQEWVKNNACQDIA